MPEHRARGPRHLPPMFSLSCSSVDIPQSATDCERPYVGFGVGSRVFAGRRRSLNARSAIFVIMLRGQNSRLPFELCRNCGLKMPQLRQRRRGNSTLCLINSDIMSELRRANVLDARSPLLETIFHKPPLRENEPSTGRYEIAQLSTPSTCYKVNSDNQPSILDAKRALTQCIKPIPCIRVAKSLSEYRIADSESDGIIKAGNANSQSYPNG